MCGESARRPARPVLHVTRGRTVAVPRVDEDAATARISDPPPWSARGRALSFPRRRILCACVADELPVGRLNRTGAGDVDVAAATVRPAGGGETTKAPGPHRTVPSWFPLRTPSSFNLRPWLPSSPPARAPTWPPFCPPKIMFRIWHHNLGQQQAHELPMRE